MRGRGGAVLHDAGAVVLVLAAAAMGGWWMWQSGWLQRTADNSKWAVIAASAKFGFALDEIFVEGRHQTKATELLRASIVSMRLALVAMAAALVSAFPSAVAASA